jgi:hypothetical protein
MQTVTIRNDHAVSPSAVPPVTKDNPQPDTGDVLLSDGRRRTVFTVNVSARTPFAGKARL